MGMNNTPASERTHIGFFGRRNAGKSSIVNAVTGQELAVVSDVKGTTTDPVYKTMELLPLGPVMIIDTPGFDDEGMLGELRVKKTKQVLNKTDIAVLVVDASEGLKECDEQLIELFNAKNINYLIVYNKSDLLDEIPQADPQSIYASALKKENIFEVKERIASLKETTTEKSIIADKLNRGDFVVLVVPIDSAAPKGRLILPQQQTIRDILDAGAMAIVTKESELTETLEGLGKTPAMVITDSQVFKTVAPMVPKHIPLTSFSILMARYKGLLNEAAIGAAAVEHLKDGDTVLIAEGCTHHRQCDDIGTVKIPNWLRKYTGKEIKIETCSGTEFPEDLSKYAMVIHCGGCMLNEREVRYRTKCAVDQGIPITNYGTFIAYVNGILKRSLEVFPEILDMMN
ncbi:MAG: [Lachnospiraceae bacterium]|nr:[FeFe] hydrogenase H-cluster maturation GTPase HydF [Lachnospiraceae bacterium]